MILDAKMGSRFAPETAEVEEQQGEAVVQSRRRREIEAPIVHPAKLLLIQRAAALRSSSVTAADHSEAQSNCGGLQRVVEGGNLGQVEVNQLPAVPVRKGCKSCVDSRTHKTQVQCEMGQETSKNGNGSRENRRDASARSKSDEVL